MRQKIERGSENLALAEREDFAAISKLLNQWREEEAAITERIENANKHLEPLPEAIDVIQQYGALVERLHNADRVKLAHAISLTVSIDNDRDTQRQNWRHRTSRAGRHIAAPRIASHQAHYHSRHRDRTPQDLA